MIVDGKTIAEDVLRVLAQERTGFSRMPRLGIVMGTGDAATESFVRIKTRIAGRLGVELVREELSSDAPTEQAIAAVERLSQKCDGIIVQLPLPHGIDADAVLRAVPMEKDVDGIGASSQVLPPVVEAVREILTKYDVKVSGKGALVVGEGRLVGAPVASWLRERGAHVLIVTDSMNLARMAKEMDLVVLGAGAGGILKPEMVKDGAVIIDAGTSESGGEVLGDADPACAGKASVFTPVPGGVGPIAVAMIFKNLFTLMQNRRS